jgi:ubiquinone/menaquinone biosynthesis C-methylase UbiE
MTQLTDPSFLNRQYRNSSNLDARVNLHQRYSVNHYGFHPWVFDQLQLCADERVLELGCGPGHLWAENRERLPARFSLVLSDFSPGMVATARNRLSSLPASYHVADAQCIPYPDHTFDLLIANHMLYHVPDQAQAAAEVRRVLVPHGRLIAATNGRSHMQELRELVFEFDSDLHMMSSTVVDRFSLENGSKLLRPYFSDVRVMRYQDALQVTEAGALVDYVFSMMQGQITRIDWKPRFTAFVEQRLSERGPIHIRKSSGVFVCYP